MFELTQDRESLESTAPNGVFPKWGSTFAEFTELGMNWA